MTSVTLILTVAGVMTTIVSINRLMTGQGAAYAVTPRDRRNVWSGYAKRTSTGQQEETI